MSTGTLLKEIQTIIGYNKNIFFILSSSDFLNEREKLSFRDYVGRHLDSKAFENRLFLFTTLKSLFKKNKQIHKFEDEADFVKFKQSFWDHLFQERAGLAILKQAQAIKMIFEDEKDRSRFRVNQMYSYSDELSLQYEESKRQIHELIGLQRKVDAFLKAEREEIINIVQASVYRFLEKQVKRENNFIDNYKFRYPWFFLGVPRKVIDEELIPDAIHYFKHELDRFFPNTLMPEVKISLQHVIKNINQLLKTVEFAEIYINLSVEIVLLKILSRLSADIIDDIEILFTKKFSGTDSTIKKQIKEAFEHYILGSGQKIEKEVMKVILKELDKYFSEIIENVFTEANSLLGKIEHHRNQVEMKVSELKSSLNKEDSYRESLVKINLKIDEILQAF
ncbi:MAG: hypothetical protein F6J87_29925 [Spirulina sp. SIO3F2]|nr:hypothetical protein [Spirulina sp. SIO3F2]